MKSLPGFRDFYPEPLPTRDVASADVRQYIFGTWRRVAQQYGFREYDGPPLEPLELYTQKSGDEIVGQLYNFVDKGDRAVALRPEMTPTLARMVAAHERHYRKPIKWFAIPQLFRYERAQKGRLREHFQLNADIFGEVDASADAELIALLIDSLRGLKLTSDDFVIRLSSRNAWHDFFNSRCSDPVKEYEFYQAIDKLERDAESVSREKLSAIGVAYEDVCGFIKAAEPTAELQAILDNLRARGLGEFVRIDYNIIRGLAYYTGPVFEAFAKRTEHRAIAGGGRYDNLVKLLSGGKVNLPALGFGMGDVVLSDLVAELGLFPRFTAGIDAFVLIEDESLRMDSLKVIQQLRDAGRAVDFSFTAMKPDKQFKRAMDQGASHTVRLARQADGSVLAMVKKLATREEKAVGLADVATAVV